MHLRHAPSAHSFRPGDGRTHMMDYYFVDWVAMALSLLSVYLLGQKNRLGFVTFMASNALWVVVGVWASSMGILIGNVMFFGLNLRGLMQWTAAEGTPAPEAAPVQRCP